MQSKRQFSSSALFCPLVFLSYYLTSSVGFLYIVPVLKFFLSPTWGIPENPIKAIVAQNMNSVPLAVGGVFVYFVEEIQAENLEEARPSNLQVQS